ncbi:MAG: hypothetical protein J6S85_25100 [Methanobrevibacter sp.]|nr:hypothetical protein [Methanobrevibacter sp.]
MLKTVLKKEDWIKGRYYTKVNCYVTQLVCASNKPKVRKYFKKITNFRNRSYFDNFIENKEIIVYMTERPTIDIPIEYI